MDSRLLAAFDPRSVAIIGASRHEEKIGFVILRQLIRAGYEGRIYPVNPSAKEILGLRCYKSVADVPDEIDLAVIAVPAKVVPSVMRNCGAKGVKVAVVISSGFSEIGNKELEEKVIRIAKEHGVRVIGPNCMGVFNPEKGLDMLFVKDELLPRCRPGSVALLSQSGSVGTNMMSALRKMNMGLSKFVSYGNKADVDEADLLEILREDPTTKVVSIYLEGVRDGRRLMDAIKRTVPVKPVVVIKVGRSQVGERAVASHTGSLAGSSDIYLAALRQAGAILVETFEQLLDVSKGLSMQPPSGGRRVFVITNGGGYGIMAVDELERRGIVLPRIPEPIKRALREEFPPYYSIDNPMDLTADSTSDQYRRAMELLGSSDECDSLLVIPLLGIPGFDPMEVAEVMVDFRKRFKKPIVVSFISHTKETDRAKEFMEKNDVPVYESPERAALVIQKLVEYGEILRRIKSSRR